MVTVSFIIINWNTPALTAQAVESIKRHERTVPHEILVVDNGSTDGSAGILSRRFPDIRVIDSGKNLGFAGGNNLGARHATGRYLLFLNSDAYLGGESLPYLLRAMGETTEGRILACRLLNPDGSPQPSVFPFPSIFSQLKECFSSTSALLESFRKRQAGLQGDPARVDWASGAFLMMAHKDFGKLGGMDDSIFMYAEDLELCRRAAGLGIFCYYCPGVAAYHVGGASANPASLRSLILTDSGRLAYWRKWHGTLSAIGLRAVFCIRSLLRLTALGLAGLGPQGHAAWHKASVHGRGLLFLLGWKDVRNFI